jgi:hypothetical protein
MDRSLTLVPVANGIDFMDACAATDELTVDVLQLPNVQL